MKQATLKDTSGILDRIDSIEKEIMDLKLSVLKKSVPSKAKTISLKGILKGVEITEDDIAAAKKTLPDRNI